MIGERLAGKTLEDKVRILKERRKHRSEWVQAWYKVHPEPYMKSGKHRPGYESERYAKKRLALLKLLGDKCAECGNSDYRVLQLNHLNGQGREDVRNYWSEYAFYEAVLSGKRTTEDLNLLCGNCNILFEYSMGRRGKASPLRLAVIQLLGGKCEACGNSDPRVLQVNHIGSKSKVDRPYVGIRTFYRSILKNNRKDVNLMCANCNILYEYKRGRRRQLKQRVEAEK